MRRESGKPPVVHPNRLSLRVIDAARIAPAEEDALAGMLSDDERRRVSSALDAESGRRFSIVRGALRMILAERLGGDPRALRFEYSRWGKPRLAYPENGARFNLSHCGDLACIAIADDVELGVDIEALGSRPGIRSASDFDEVGRHMFAPSELCALEKLSKQDRAVAFYDVWTRREAILKTLGSGFAEPPETFAVPVASDIRSHQIQVRDAAGALRDFTLISLGEPPRAFDLGLGPDVVGALALELTGALEVEVRTFRV